MFKGSTMFRILTSLALLLAAATLPSAVRADEQDLLRSVNGGAVLPFSALRSMVSRQVGGRLIGSELDESQARSGTYIYRMTFLQDGGNVVRVDVDARSGRILGVEGK
jgi:uncharacterized membrane protein YkoI